VAARPLDVELAADAELPHVSMRYGKLRLLVRVGGRPVASVDVDNAPRGLALDDLRESLAQRLGAEVWADLALRDVAPPETEAPPAVTVVVCTRNRPDSLAVCLEALAAQDHPDYAVIVVDNAPTDERTREVAERFRVGYVVEPRPGLDWARNRGLEAARTDIVAYTDDDAKPDRGWLRALCAGFVAEEVVAVTGLVAPAELATRAQALFEDVYGGMGKGFQERVFSRRGQALNFRPHAYGVGCNMAFRRRALVDLGGFDPALDTGTASGGGGELDAFQRGIERGLAVVYRPDAIVRHTHRRTLTGLRRQLFDNGRGFCAALCAAFGRASGRDRARLVLAWWRWIAGWHVRRIVRRLLRRESMPLRLLLAELRGALLGPLYYRRARRDARRLEELRA
jgi:glycosyltransferase involved in cell wall biosynthesis